MTPHCHAEILRAARILRQMEKAHAEQKGAVGLATEDGGKEMIDAPMLKQVESSFGLFCSGIDISCDEAENTVRLAMAAGLEIPQVD